MRTRLVGALWVLLIGCLVLVGCSAISRDPPEVLKVPVAVMPTPHEDLLECGDTAPQFIFQPVESRPDYVQLSPFGQQALQEWVDGKQSCIRAWRAWAAPDSAASSR